MEMAVASGLPLVPEEKSRIHAILPLMELEKRSQMLLEERIPGYIHSNRRLTTNDGIGCIRALGGKF